MILHHLFISEDNTIETLRHVVLNVGVNDLDTKDPDTILKEYKNIVEEIRKKFPNIKFIISEITPRNDIRDINYMGHLVVIMFRKIPFGYFKPTANKIYKRETYTRKSTSWIHRRQ